MGKRPQDRVKAKKAKSARASKPVKRAPLPKSSKRNVPIIRTTGKSSPQTSYKRPETLPMWERLESVKISGKEECVQAFLRIMREVGNGSYAIEPGTRDMGKYVVVHETDRQGSVFVHVVPKEAQKVFGEMRRQMPDSFLGFSVLCGKVGGRDVRVSCFGIPTSEITRAMIGRS